MDADLYYLVGRGRSVKKHPDVVVAQSNAQAGMGVGAIFDKRCQVLADQLLVERRVSLYQFYQFLSRSFFVALSQGAGGFCAGVPRAVKREDVQYVMGSGQ